MRFAKPALTLVTLVALAVYGFDCAVTSTPDEAMQCCDSMPCSHHGHEHSEDCCKTMPSMHAPFVQADSPHGVQLSQVLFGVLPMVSDSARPHFSIYSSVTAQSHAPPIPQPAVISPLRI